MKIKKFTLDGSNIIEGVSYRYYTAKLTNGKSVKIEQNTQTGKFQVGIGRSKDRDANQFDSPTEAIEALEAVEVKKASMTLEYDEQKQLLTVNGAYDYEGVKRTDYNRIKKIALGDSPHRAWADLKKFSVTKLV